MRLHRCFNYVSDYVNRVLTDHVGALGNPFKRKKLIDRLKRIRFE